MKILSQSAQLALDTLNQKPVKGIPSGLVHIMEHSVIERLAGAQSGDYRNDPHGVYVTMLQNIGTNMVDQYLAENPLKMGAHGYEGAEKTATTGGCAELDGNLMRLVPRLLECGINGFQGFQYEDGMDYLKICAMKARDGTDLIIMAGVSVTRTLPLGTCS